MADDTHAPAGDRRTILFLSYARPDRAHAQKLASALEQAGYELWWDALIEGGAQFARSIDEALAKADAVLVLWSRRSVQSNWVRDEAAAGRDRRRLVPLSIDGSEPPLGFRQYHMIDLAGWHGRADAPEIAAIARAIATLAPGLPSPRPSIGRGRPVSRRVMLAGGVGAGVLAVAGVLWEVRDGLSGGAGQDSIAVLPFRNLSGDPEQAYFSQGLTEEVRAALRRMAALKVVASASSEAASQSRDDAPTIARRLGVAYLLEGSVQRAGGLVRIAVDLTDGATGFSRWSTRLDRPMTDVFALESEVAGLVAGAMSARMVTAAPPPGGTTDIATYEHFLRGRALFNLGKDEPTDRAALAAFDQAVTIDPRFALAQAARSRSLAAIAAEYAKADQLQPLYDQSVRAAQREIDLTPDLAEAQLAMAFVLFTRLQVGRARLFYDRAYALAHGNADIILLFALYCSRTGRAADAARTVAQAIVLDPLNARTYRAAGSIAYAAHRYRAALAPLRRALALNPGLSNAHALIGASLMQLGDDREAKAEFEAEPHAMFRLAGLAIVGRRLGDMAAAARARDALFSEGGANALYQQAQVLAQWGDTAAALASLRRARDVGDSGLIYLATDPLLDPLRGAPEFTRLIREMGFA